MIVLIAQSLLCRFLILKFIYIFFDPMPTLLLCEQLVLHDILPFIIDQHYRQAVMFFEIVVC